MILESTKFWGLLQIVFLTFLFNLLCGSDDEFMPMKLIRENLPSTKGRGAQMVIQVEQAIRYAIDNITEQRRGPMSGVHKIVLESVEVVIYLNSTTNRGYRRV